MSDAATRTLVRDPSGILHAIDPDEPSHTECGQLIRTDWTLAERDYHPDFCRACKRYIKSALT